MPKSIVLNRDELMRFQFWVNTEFAYKKQAAEKLGISTALMSRIYYAGRGAPETMKKVFEVINPEPIAE
jgi:hypothetical protein